MSKDEAVGSWKRRPMLTHGALGQVFGVGAVAVKNAALRLGIEGSKMANGRDLLSFEQAEAVANDMNARASH